MAIEAIQFLIEHKKNSKKNSYVYFFTAGYFSLSVTYIYPQIWSSDVVSVMR